MGARQQFIDFIESLQAPCFKCVYINSVKNKVIVLPIDFTYKQFRDFIDELESLSSDNDSVFIGTIWLCDDTWAEIKHDKSNKPYWSRVVKPQIPSECF